MNIKKRYRTLWLLFCSAAMVLCGCQVAEGGRLPEGFEEEKVREKAECVGGWFNEQEYGKIIEARNSKSYTVKRTLDLREKTG